jgi:SAM-dependent methyltransferase
MRRWLQGRLWQNYDQSYDVLLSHAPMHRRWVAENLASPPPASLFSIGPGRGELELALCKDFGCRVGYVETYPPYFKAVTDQFRHAKLDEHIIEKHQGAYQTFVPQQHYDLILSVHSWYSFGYDQDLIQRTLNALSPEGSFILTITSAEDFFFTNTLKKQEFSAEDLSRWATEQGFSHDLNLLRQSVPATTLVTNGALTKDAKNIISFLKGKLWRKIPQADRQQIEQRLLQAAQEDNVERVYGLLHFKKSDQA